MILYYPVSKEMKATTEKIALMRERDHTKNPPDLQYHSETEGVSANDRGEDRESVVDEKLKVLCIMKNVSSKMRAMMSVALSGFVRRRPPPPSSP